MADGSGRGRELMADAKRPYGRSRRDLASVATRLFDEKGFASTTVEEIAEAARYSPRTFFRQFATKEDVVFFDFPTILRPLEQLLEDPPPSAWEAVCAIIIDNGARWETAGPELAQRRTRLFHEEPALYRRFLELASEWEAVICGVVAAERGADPATDTHAQVLATSVMGACRAALKLWLEKPERSLRDHTADALRLVESGFGLTDRSSG